MNRRHGSVDRGRDVILFRRYAATRDPDTRELIAGFWLIQVKSRDEAVEWAKRCPNPMPASEGAIELLYALDIMVGDGKNFNPESAVTRAEMAKMMAVFGSPSVTSPPTTVSAYK